MMFLSFNQLKFDKPQVNDTHIA